MYLVLCTIRYFPGTLSYYSVLSGVIGYYCVPPGTTMYREVSSGISYIWPLPFPIRGKVRYVPACSFPIREQALSVPPGTSQRLSFPIRGKARYVCTCPFSIRDKLINVLPDTVRYQVLPAFALPFSGQSQAHLYSTLPYSGASYQCFNKCYEFPVHCAVCGDGIGVRPFPIWEQSQHFIGLSTVRWVLVVNLKINNFEKLLHIIHMALIVDDEFMTCHRTWQRCH